MKCERCGFEVVQGAKFCNNCGTPIFVNINNNANGFDNTNPYQQTQPINQYGYYQPLPEKKNKGKGCLIAILIVIGMFVFFGIIGTIVGDDTDNKTEYQYDNAQSTEETTIPTAIEESIIYDKHNVKIIVKGINNNIISFYIENNSNLNYGFQAHSYAINGIMTRNNPHDMGCKVPSKSKANTELEINEAFLKEFSITDIQTIDINFWVSDNEETYEHFNTGRIRIKTNKFSSESQKIKSNKNIYNNKGVSIDYIKHDGNKYFFSINNANDILFTFFVNNITINDYSLTETDLDLVDEEVLDNCQYVFSINISDDFLEKNGIENVEKIRFKVSIQDNDDYRNEWSTGDILLEVNKE